MIEEKLVILVPVFNDWNAAFVLLEKLNSTSICPSVILINDGSTDHPAPILAQSSCDHLRSVEILHLRRNLGHQRAIAVGLMYAYQHRPCDVVVVMDGDGEDRPADVAVLLDKVRSAGGREIVFAARAKRIETVAFRFLYQAYKLIHWAITGDTVRVGNFSAIPFHFLSQLSVTPEIWNHYAAGVIRSRLPFHTVPIARGRRYSGKSKMNFTSLLLHGLAAFFVYGDIVGARMLVAIGTMIALEIVCLPWVSWPATVVVTLALIQSIPIALLIVFCVMGNRSNGFLPIRDCPYFVDRIEQLHVIGDGSK